MGSVTLSDANGWEGSFQQVPLYPDAKPGSPAEVFNFNVREPYIPGYVTAVRNVAAETDPVPSFEVTNTLKYRNIGIKKIWEDNDDALKFRPDSVIVEVMEEGNVQAEVTLSKNTNPAWTATVTLPDLINGQTATYEVREKTVTGPYRTSVTGTDETGFEVINTLLPQTTDIQVTKEWLDVTEDHPEITLRLLSDEKQAGKFEEAGSCTLNKGTGWTHIFSDMRVYTDDGRVIIYDLTEDELPGYGAPVVFDQDYSFIIFNWKIPERAKVIVLKTWSDQDDADGLRPDRVSVELLRNGEPTGKIIDISEETGWYATFEDLDYRDEQDQRIQYFVREEPVAGYDTSIVPLLGASMGEYGTTYLEIINTRNAKDVFTITYDPNGGILHGSGEPESSVHEDGETIMISEAPTREDYRFLYWKGSEYQPGDSYTVTGDHTFVAQWEKIPPEPPYDFRFVFTKKWSGSTEDSINWTLYNPDGSIRHKKFNKKIISDTEWRYEAGFETAADYYIIEEVPEGYHVRYENVGAHAGETDRCYNGGTIINYRIPKTGDNAPLLLWSAGVLLGTAGMLGLVFRRRLRGKKKMNRPQ